MIYILLLLSGILTAVSTMFTWSGFLSFFSLIPFAYAVFSLCYREEGVRFKTLFLVGSVFSISFFLTVYHWFWYLYPMEFLGFSKTAAFFCCLFFQIGLSLLQAIIYSLIPIVCRLAAPKRHAWLFPIILSATWISVEYITTFTWMGVPWARLALSQVNFAPMLKNASLLGSLFISFIIVLINGYLAIALHELIKKGGIRKIRKSLFKPELIKPLAAALLIFVASVSLGGSLLLFSESESEENRVGVALVQTNIGSGDKWDVGFFDALDTAMDMTTELSEDYDADIIVWPETTLTFSLNDNHTVSHMISSLAKKVDSIIIVGAFETMQNEDGEEELYNSLIAFFPDGTIEEQGYAKRKLVPFGEYVPMRSLITSLFPFLDDISMLSDDLSHGRESNILPSEHGNIGRLICFDSIYPSLTTDSVNDGASFFILSTNDSWYRDSASAYQHVSHAVLRAAESGRWIGRCATTGISCIISPSGKIESSLPALERGYVSGDLYSLERPTLYSVVKDILPLLSLTALVFLSAFNVYRRIRDKRTPLS